MINKSFVRHLRYQSYLLNQSIESREIVIHQPPPSYQDGRFAHDLAQAYQFSERLQQQKHEAWEDLQRLWREQEDLREQEAQWQWLLDQEVRRQRQRQAKQQMRMNEEFMNLQHPKKEPFSHESDFLS